MRSHGTSAAWDELRLLVGVGGLVTRTHENTRRQGVPYTSAYRGEGTAAARVSRRPTRRKTLQGFSREGAWLWPLMSSEC
jgi:hypothetical protein